MKRLDAKPIIINTISFTITGAIITWIIFGPLNEKMQKLLEMTAKNDKAMEIVIWTIPVLLVLGAVVNMGNELISLSLGKEGKSKINKKKK